MPMGLSVAKLDVAFLGDIQGLLPLTMVYFPADSFGHTGNLPMPKPDTLHPAFSGDPASESIRP